METREDIEECMCTKVEAWYHRFCTLSKMANQYPQLTYVGLGMFIQLEWQYLQMTVPGVDTVMGPIEDSLIEDLFTESFGGE